MPVQESPPKDQKTMKNPFDGPQRPIFAYDAVIGEKAQESGCLHGYDVRHDPVPFCVEHLRDGTKNYLPPAETPFS